MRLLFHSLLIATVVVVTPGQAEESAVVDTEAAAPAAPALSGRVGCLSLLSGNIGFRATSETAWTAAETNLPIFSGASVRTNELGRAEIGVGADTIVLASGTEIEIAGLTARVFEIALARGRIGVDLRRFGEDESVEVDIPGGGVWLSRPGRYVIDAGDREQRARVSVFEGRARLVGGAPIVTIAAGEIAAVSVSQPGVTAIEPAAPAAFAELLDRLADDETGLGAPGHVSDEMTGIEALDAAGNWETTSEYGAVWFPKEVDADWAPYRYGHWRWLPPWGWTWFDDQPWGFAPFHYGRWVLIGERWGWVPGNIWAPPVYAPALVAFLGTPGVGLSFAEGNGPAIGWFPLAPDEVYWPSYTRDLNYIRTLNLADVRYAAAIRMDADGEAPVEVVGEPFANRLFASVVPRPVFAGGRTVAPALVTLPERRLQDAPVIMGSPRVSPAAPPRVAAAAPPTARIAIRPPKSASWATAVRAATIRSRSYQQMARAHGAHPRAPARAAPSGVRHTVALRMTHPMHGAARSRAGKKESGR
jgi:hypothetical protein